MSQLLLPILPESCQTSLRERRRSSIRPLSVAPSFLSKEFGAQRDSAVVDDPTEPEKPASDSCPNHRFAVSTPNLSYIKTRISGDHRALPALNIRDLSPDTPVDSESLQSPFAEEKLTEDPPRPERLRWRLASGYFAYFLCGWGDGITGTVLPYFMAEFHITFMTSSLLFAGSTCGFLIGTLLVESMMKFLGRVRVSSEKSSILPFFPRISIVSKQKREGSRYSALQSRHVGIFVSTILHSMFFVMMGSRNGFTVMFAAYAMAAFARAILTASLNAYFATNHSPSLGYSFGFWSFGGVASPLVCQAIVSKGVPWFHFYFGSLILSALNIAFLTITFAPTTGEFTRERQLAFAEMDRNNSPSSASSDVKIEIESVIDKEIPPPRNTLKISLKSPHQWAITIFSLLYCGFETATQGFMVSYLLDARHADPHTAGYVTSGFWGGITIGRFAWGYFLRSFTPAQRKWTIQICLGMSLVQEYPSHCLTRLVVVALTMQILIWLIKSAVANGFCGSVIGLVCGAVFPACLSLANDVLPEEIHLVSMALISSGASIGAAVFPFVSGVISNTKDVQATSYLNVPLGTTLIIIWAILPSRSLRQTTLN